MASTITCIASSGSAAQWVMRNAAWWKTVSVPATSLRISAASRMSPWTSSTRRLASAGGEIRDLAADHVVDDDDPVAAGVEQLIDDMRADEAGAAGHQDPLAGEIVHASLLQAFDQDVRRDAIDRLDHRGDVGLRQLGEQRQGQRIAGERFGDRERPPAVADVA